MKHYNQQLPLIGVVILCVGCAVYQTHPVPLNEAVDKGPVKVIYVYKGQPNTYSVKKYYSIQARDSNYFGIIANEEYPINDSELTSVYLLDKKKSKKRTALAVGIPIGTVLVGVAAIAIACNCPHVDVIDENGVSRFQGSIFPGSIFKSLERTDQLVLDEDPSQEQVKLMVSNVLPEEEYIDELKLLKYQLYPFERLAINQEGELVATSEGQLPILANDGTGKNRINELLTIDDHKYLFDDSPQEDQFNHLDLTFKNNGGTNNYLHIRGKQSEWLEVVANEFFYLFGDKFNKKKKKMDTIDPEKYNSNAANTGFSLRILAKIDGEYKMIGAIHNVGTKMERDVVFKLPSGLNNGKDVELRLESAYKFWELNKVELLSDVRKDLEYSELKLTIAISNNGVDVSNQIREQDQQYATLLDAGNNLSLNFSNTSYHGTMDSKLVLKASGYYKHKKEFTHKINKPALKQISKPYGTHFYSIFLDQAYSNLAQNK